MPVLAFDCAPNAESSRMRTGVARLAQGVLAIPKAVRPGRRSLSVQHLLGDCDLLLARRLPRIAGVDASAVAEPGVGVELQTAVVGGVEVPASARFALCDGIPIDAPAGRGRGRLHDLLELL